MHALNKYKHKLQVRQHATETVTNDSHSRKSNQTKSMIISDCGKAIEQERRD